MVKKIVKKIVERWQYNIDVRTQANKDEICQSISTIAKIKKMKNYEALQWVLRKELKSRKIKLEK